MKNMPAPVLPAPVPAPPVARYPQVQAQKTRAQVAAKGLFAQSGNPTPSKEGLTDRNEFFT